MRNANKYNKIFVEIISKDELYKFILEKKNDYDCPSKYHYLFKPVINKF